MNRQSTGAERSQDRFLSGLRAGDEGVLVDIASECRKPFLAAFARGRDLFLDEQDLDGCFYEALAELWDARQRIDPTLGSVRGFLFGIMRNRVRHVLTRETRQQEMCLAAAAEAEGSPRERGQGIDAGPLHRAVRNSLEELAEPYRTLLVVDAWCYPRVAASSTVSRITGLPVRQVGTYRTRARHKLRRLLESEGVNDQTLGTHGEAHER